MMVNKLRAGDFLRADVAGNENIYMYPVKHADGSISLMVVNENDPEKQAPAQITLTLPAQAATGTMPQMAGPTFASEDQTRSGGLESSGVALADQARVSSFSAGDQTVTISLNSGKASILKFTY